MVECVVQNGYLSTLRDSCISSKIFYWSTSRDMKTVDVGKSKRREQIPLLDRENEKIYHFQVAAFKVIHGGHYILGPKSKKVSAGKGQ